ncbi:unnamed protein product [Pleuronectes platessa]|uniref:Uncharacterized protein n=1 Tax=Pleuronectes platessa TaxID=8262 RepID=A0A9N7UHT9_PLEPL|nr:unnamed protein product [Pleuronectes platessa]
MSELWPSQQGLRAIKENWTDLNNQASELEVLTSSLPACKWSMTERGRPGAFLARVRLGTVENRAGPFKKRASRQLKEAFIDTMCSHGGEAGGPPPPTTTTTTISIPPPPSTDPILSPPHSPLRALGPTLN